MTTFTCAAKRIATFILWAKAYDNEHRIIRCARDLTDADKAEIKTTTDTVKSILASGKTWNDTLAALHGIATKSFTIGFKEQDRIIAACNRNGIRFAE